jgi:hypothetical protein
MPRQFVDAQAAMAFMVNQAAYIESEVYRTQYPELQYPMLVPIDESAPEWTKSVTFYSIDRVGEAQWFHHSATDVRLADVQRSAYEQGIEMAAIGYRYTLEEIGQAMMIGWNLTTERAGAAVRAAEEFTEKIALVGDTNKGWTGIINATGVTATTAQAGVGGIPWALKTGDEIIRDVNNALSDIYANSATIEMANTILLPVAQYSLISTKRLNDQLDMTVLEWLNKYNVYTAQTGQPLTIRAVRQLSTAGSGLTARMMVYRRDPSVLKMHIPMRHRFLPVWQTGPITFDIPGIFRLGGAEIRRPGAVRYVDGI